MSISSPKPFVVILLHRNSNSTVYLAVPRQCVHKRFITRSSAFQPNFNIKLLTISVTVINHISHNNFVDKQ